MYIQAPCAHMGGIGTIPSDMLVLTYVHSVDQ